MRVLAIFPSLHDDNPGGIQVSGRIAWQGLQQNAQATLLEVSAGHKLAAVREVRRPRGEVDVVLFWHLDLLRLAPLLPGRARRAVFLHGIEAWRRPDPLTRRLLRSTHVLVNSHYTVERAQSALGGLPMKVVHLGVGDAAQLTTPPAAPPVALMLGRLDAGERYKGHHEVIRCWPNVQKLVPDAQLWMVGDGDLRDELQAEVHDQQLDSAVRFFGRVSETEKQTLLAAASTLVLPSRGEGFGLVYLEAMRCGRPCIVGTDAGREVVNPPEAGLSVDPSDPGALAHAIVLLLKRGPEWQRMADAARRRHAGHFTAAHFQARLRTALEQLN